MSNMSRAMIYTFICRYLNKHKVTYEGKEGYEHESGDTWQDGN